MVSQAYETDGSGQIALANIGFIEHSAGGLLPNSENGNQAEIVWHNAVEEQAWLEFDLNDADPCIVVDTTELKSFRVSWVVGDPDDSQEVRLNCIAFQDDGTQILPVTNTADAWKMQFEGNVPSSTYGEGWGWTGTTLAPGQAREITVADDVTRVVVALRDEAELRSMAISVPPDDIHLLPLRCYHPEITIGGSPRITAAPSQFGKYPAGWFGIYENGVTMQVCTTAGYRAKAWAGSTAYTVGRLRENGGNIYVCVTAGTSAASGGPTGTGTGITDNTVTWDYVGPKRRSPQKHCNQFLPHRDSAKVSSLCCRSVQLASTTPTASSVSAGNSSCVSAAHMRSCCSPISTPPSCVYLSTSCMH